jgi:hypothetical protein
MATSLRRAALYVRVSTRDRGQMVENSYSRSRRSLVGFRWLRGTTTVTTHHDGNLRLRRAAQLLAIEYHDSRQHGLPSWFS